MLDKFNRKIDYLRISVTDRCNLRCSYCMPCGEFVMMSHNDIISYDEITAVVKEAAAMGVTKVRLTGGEPLVRKGVCSLVKMIASVKGIDDLSMTTNGILLDKYAHELASAGLMRVNISLDTVDPEKYRIITSGGDVRKVYDGIDAALSAGLIPVKINCVINGSSDDPDALGVRNFANEKGVEVRFIHQMDLERGTFAVVEGGDGGNCSQCNRLRLTADGKIKPCLFSDISYDVREMGARNALLAATGTKPAKGTVSYRNHFYNIGG